MSSKVKIKKVIFTQNKYKYDAKAEKAMREGNAKYLQSLIDRGKMVVFNPEDVPIDFCL